MPIHPPRRVSVVPFVQPSPSSAAYVAPHASFHVLPPNFGLPPPLMSSNLYVLSPITLSYHLDVKNPQIHSTFDVGESSTHSNSNEQVSSSGIAQQKLGGLQQQIATIKATLGMISNTLVPMYSENRRTSLGDDLQYSRMEEIDRIYGFLVGLNPKFDIVRGHILHQRPIPSLMEVYYEIRLEENCTSAMSILATPNIDFAAFSARSSNSGSDKHDRKPIPVCENSKKQWHTKEQYWKLHGRSPGGKKRDPNDKQNTGWAYVSESSGPSQPLDPHGNQTYFSPATLGAIVQSDHLTGSSEHFMLYIPCVDNETFRIADGSLAPIAGKGKISTYTEISLHNDLSLGKKIDAT
ncbi:Beta-galactosidase [Cucumis melo var. makuwa]|uniref:Beta-galactosidase n=1 Tax=Cucumis melo var. makuwa TaxID=1194695 RepID=A0A5D3C7Y3_CUCMM|nr:Beta-galactosidase [Cucumis melo var. makuwa]